MKNIKSQAEITFDNPLALIANVQEQFATIRAKGFHKNIKDIFVIEKKPNGNYAWYLCDDSDTDPTGFSVSSSFIYDWIDSGELHPKLEEAIGAIAHHYSNE